VVEAGQPVFVNPAPASVVDTGTGQLSKCCDCFQKPGVQPSPPVGVVVVVVVDGVVVVVVVVVVDVDVDDVELVEGVDVDGAVLLLVLLPVSVANPEPVMAPAAMKPLTARTVIARICPIRRLRFFMRHLS
jgi:hypothetical protein